MRRRKYLAAVGSLAAGGAAMMGTGAFTSTQADRTLVVETAGDADAFLSLEAQPNSPNADAYVTEESNGTIRIEAKTTPNGGSGVNKEATTIIRDLIQVKNQGTQGYIFGHTQDFAPQTAFLFHDDPGFKTGGNQLQAGEVFNSLGAPDNSGTNLDNIATKNLAYPLGGETVDNIGLGVGIGSDDPSLPSGTVTFVAATDPSELP
jgi:hypothetical protein